MTLYKSTPQIVTAQALLAFSLSTHCYAETINNINHSFFELKVVHGEIGLEGPAFSENDIESEESGFGIQLLGSRQFEGNWFGQIQYELINYDDPIDDFTLTRFSASIGYALPVDFKVGSIQMFPYVLSSVEYAETDDLDPLPGSFGTGEDGSDTGGAVGFGFRGGIDRWQTDIGMKYVSFGGGDGAQWHADLLYEVNQRFSAIIGFDGSWIEDDGLNIDIAVPLLTVGFRNHF